MTQELKDKILNLKKEKNAIILAHFYAPDEAQELADYVGDSFYLAKVAKETNADVLVFCGVSFMGESAKILNPEKTVLMPDITSDCPMAHMVKEGKIEEMRNTYDDLAIVCYINSTAELKCKSDVCVTSSNAVKIVRALKNKNIFFIPDENLGRFVKEQVPEKNVILNDGFCPIHVAIDPEIIQEEKCAHPDAEILAHPECKKDLLQMADFIGSTAEIISYVSKSNAKEFIICTEHGVEYELKTAHPEKCFYFGKTLPCCADMKLNTAENILHVLETGGNEVIVAESVQEKALLPLKRMLEFGAQK